MTAEPLPHLSFEDFLAGEQRSLLRHEYVAGRVYYMAGGTERHDLMTGLLYEHFAPRARQRGCVPFQQNRLVRIGATGYYPDVLVICPGEVTPHELYERDLSLVVEVMSPSTEDGDRREKALAYTAAPGFEAHLVVDPRRRRVEVATRGDDGAIDWTVYGAGEFIVEFELDLDELYGNLDAVART